MYTPRLPAQLMQHHNINCDLEVVWEVSLLLRLKQSPTKHVQAPDLQGCTKAKTSLVAGDLLPDGKSSDPVLGKLCPWVTKAENTQTKVPQNLFLSLEGPATDAWENAEEEGRCVTLLPHCSTLNPSSHQLKHFQSQWSVKTRLLVFFLIKSSPWARGRMMHQTTETTARNWKWG